MHPQSVEEGTSLSGQSSPGRELCWFGPAAQAKPSQTNWPPFLGRMDQNRFMAGRGPQVRDRFTRCAQGWLEISIRESLRSGPNVLAPFDGNPRLARSGTGATRVSSSCFELHALLYATGALLLSGLLPSS